MELDLVIRNGNVVTATEEVFCDIGIAKGRIATLGKKLEEGRSIDAEGTTSSRRSCPLPHRAALSSGLLRRRLLLGTVSAAFSGTTTIVPFAASTGATR
jgi:dihydropyrimidinase